MACPFWLVVKTLSLDPGLLMIWMLLLQSGARNHGKKSARVKFADCFSSKRKLFWVPIYDVPGLTLSSIAQAVIFVDNSGADIILGILPFARELLHCGTQVLFKIQLSCSFEIVYMFARYVVHLLYGKTKRSFVWLFNVDCIIMTWYSIDLLCTCLLFLVPKCDSGYL